MIATVTGRTERGTICVQVRRSSKIEHLYTRPEDIKIGDRIEVRRQTNNPYLIYVGREK